MLVYVIRSLFGDNFAATKPIAMLVNRNKLNQCLSKVAVVTTNYTDEVTYHT